MDHLPVAQDGDVVAELQHLLVAMADEDDGDALGGERPDRREQPGGIVGTQRRRRFVEHEDSRALQRQHLGDLDELALRLRQLGDRCVHRDVVDHQRAQRPAGDVAGDVGVDPQMPRDLAAEGDVLRHREVR